MSDIASESIEQSPEGGRGKELPRRRFVRGAGAAVPLVLTVAARSSLAGTACLSPSAKASIALYHSRPDRLEGQCSGCTPGYWKNCGSTHPTVWSTAQQYNVAFGSIFPGTSLATKTMIEVMGNNDPSQDPANLGAHLAGAYFNLMMGLVPSSVVSLQELQAMWAGRTNGYSPTAGVVWYAADIVAYLQTTMTQ